MTLPLDGAISKADATTTLDAGFVRLPWRRRCTWVPTTDRVAATAGICLYPASGRWGVAAQSLTWSAVRLFGPRMLPGRRVNWQAPFSQDTWSQLVADWQSALGKFESVAIYSRPQESRAGCSFLLVGDSQPLAFVKVRPNAAELEVEHQVLTQLHSVAAKSFHVPDPVGAGEVDGWHWLALRPLPPHPHRPNRAVDPTSLGKEVRDLLRDVLQPDPTVPPHWTPMHGDMTPWNLRRVGTSTWLVDWEDAGWAPPDADEVYYEAVSSTLYGSKPVTHSGETVDFWLRRVGARSPGDDDAPMNATLLRVLRRMRD